MSAWLCCGCAERAERRYLCGGLGCANVRAAEPSATDGTAEAEAEAEVECWD
jgi:hypothetical protein